MAKLNKTKLNKEILIKRPDVLYNSWWLEKFKNKFLVKGKKALIERAIDIAFIEIKKQTNQSPIKYFYKGMTYIKPLVRVLGKRKGEFKIDIPTPLDIKSQWYTAIKFIVKSTRNRQFLSLDKKLIEEFLTNPYIITELQLLEQINKKWETKKIRNKKMKMIKIDENNEVETTNFLLNTYKNNIKQIIDSRVNSRKRWI